VVVGNWMVPSAAFLVMVNAYERVQDLECVETVRHKDVAARFVGMVPASEVHVNHRDRRSHSADLEDHSVD
jgi:hypothetical protein